MLDIVGQRQDYVVILMKYFYFIGEKFGFRIIKGFKYDYRDCQ